MSYLIGPEPIAPKWRGINAKISRRETAPPGRVPAAMIDTALAEKAEPLVEILEGAILPRLLAAHGLMPKARDPASTAPVPDHLDVEALVPMALDSEADALLEHVDAMLRDGMTVDSLFVDLLAPAARYIGELWEDDRCDFIEVTMGLWRLQEVVREISARLPPDRRPDCGSRHALFAAMPEEQHSFGTVLIDETFRREGWKTDALLDSTRPELIERIARDWFDVVGLTVSRDCNIDPLPHLIRALRSVSRNPRIVVMVGGRVFMGDPSLAAAVGADGTAPDAVRAVAIAGSLVNAVACEARASG